MLSLLPILAISSALLAADAPKRDWVTLNVTFGAGGTWVDRRSIAGSDALTYFDQSVWLADGVYPDDKTPARRRAIDCLKLTSYEVRGGRLADPVQLDPNNGGFAQLYVLCVANRPGRRR